jgi:chaperonin cofactor prefoldin
MSLEAKLQQASVEYQKLQADLSKTVEARQRLDAQLSENELVKKVSLVIDYLLLGENHSDTTFPGI